MANTFDSCSTLRIDQKEYTIFRLDAVAKIHPHVQHLPFSLKILLENILRTEDGQNVRADDIAALAQWDPTSVPAREIAFTPARVLLQDFTGVPAIVDLAAMRDAMKRLGGDPTKINPLQPVELVIDHSVQVDDFGNPQAFQHNAALEYQRNQERYLFLRWGQNAFRNFRVVPPETGIVHQVNLEYLARVVFMAEGETGRPEAGVRDQGSGVRGQEAGVNDNNKSWALQPPASGLPPPRLPMLYPDTVVGTDSHTTMINGLGVLGWGVGGIEAEAAMLGQPVSMLIPQVVGFKLYGQLPEGATATDLVLTVTQMLRKKGVVGKFVEFFGEGLAFLPLADRATIANMAPEYGATCGIFPVDEETLAYLRLTGRSEAHIRRVETYCKEQGLFRTAGSAPAKYSDTLELDLGTVVPSLAGPSRPQDRVPLTELKKSFLTSLPNLQVKGAGRGTKDVEHSPLTTHHSPLTTHHSLQHGSVVIAAITSCTNTSNPSVLLAAGLLAKKAVERGLQTKPWVKTSLAPGSKAVTEYLSRAGVLPYLERLRFYLVGYGCTTCIGNSGPLPAEVSKAIAAQDLVVAAVLSGNRNFEGRIHAEVRANYLASPPLVVAMALAGRVDIDLASEPLGQDAQGQPVFLRDIWPTQAEISQAIAQAVQPDMFAAVYRDIFQGDEHWRGLAAPGGDLFSWQPASTYVKHPPYFDNLSLVPPPVQDIRDGRVLALLGDSITTDHISPAGSIKEKSPAGQYLMAQGVQPADFNQYGARRGNHEVMVRGTFANVRLKNLLAPGTEGGVTRHLPNGAQMTIYDAAMKYKDEGIPLFILAGKEYGAGSSRDWAAKGPRLLGVAAVIAESFERIHRSNLVGMGVLPLQFIPGENAASLGLTGEEIFDLEGLPQILGPGFAPGKEITVRAKKGPNSPAVFRAIVRIDTPQEVLYYLHGGILQYVLRQLLEGK